MPIVKIVQPSGILDSGRANLLRREISDIAEKGVDIVLIDLQDISFMDSSGLGGLVSAYKTVRTSGGKLFLCSLNDQVQMLFELTKMQRVFDIFSDQNEFKRTVFPED